MNNRPEDLDQPLLDKLVDGELTSIEQRDLLLRLDEEPHAWRRLALAFLESRTWQRELSACASAAAGLSSVADAKSGVIAASSPVARAPQRPVVKPPRRKWSALTAIAASVCVVFGLGFACGSLRPDAGSPTVVATKLPTLDSALPVVSIVDPAPADTEPDPETIRVYLAGDTPDTYREVDLPIVETNDDDSTLLASQPPFVPEQVRRTLERMGHEVQEERHLIPLQLPDGREGVVPVDDVQVRFVGQKSYQ